MEGKAGGNPRDGDTVLNSGPSRPFDAPSAPYECPCAASGAEGLQAGYRRRKTVEVPQRTVRGPPGPVEGADPLKGTVGCGVEMEGLLLPLFLGLVIGYQWTRQRQSNGVQNMSTNNQQGK